jgi:hypothetical protein
MKLVEHVVRVHDVPERLGHLLALLVVDEAVREDGSGKGEIGGHEQAGPDHGVEPQNVLPDDVHVGRPKVAKLGRRPVSAHAQAIHAGHIVREG